MLHANMYVDNALTCMLTCSMSKYKCNQII